MILRDGDWQVYGLDGGMGGNSWQWAVGSGQSCKLPTAICELPTANC